MPIDPSISLGYKGMDMPNPLNQMAQVSQIQASQRQGEAAQMQLDEMKRDRDEMVKFQQELAAKGGSTDMRQYADMLLKSRNAAHQKMGIELRQKIDSESRLAKIMGLPDLTAPAAPAASAAPGMAAPSGALGSGTFGMAPEPAPVNALAPVSAAPATPSVNALAPNQDAALQQKINQAYAINSPQSLAWAKSMEDLRGKQMTAATALAGQNVTIRGQDIGQSSAIRGQDLTAATAKAGQGITLRGQNLTNQRAMDTLAQGKIPTGYRAVAGGGVEPIPGGPAAGEKPLTESQGNATAYGMRMQEANKMLTDLEKSGATDTGLISGVAGGVAGMVPLIGDKLQGATGSLFNALPRIMGGLSAEQQQVMQARINFITAQLRKESGASIAPSEFATAEKLYFPKPGDTQAVIDTKAKTRRTAIEAMKIQAGPGGKNINTGGTSSTATDPLGLR